MSRIGKKPIDIPADVKVEINEELIKVKGQKGELNWKYPVRIKLSVNDGKIFVERESDSKVDKSLHGLARSIINNMVIGVSQGYQKVLEIVGIGYKARTSDNNKIILDLGYSNSIEFQLPEGVTASVDAKQTQLTLSGIDKQQIGHIAASIRALRPPDAYKGKGIRYKGERLKLKVGKAGKR